MASTRYNAIVTQMNADLGETYGRSISTATKLLFLNQAIDWFCGINPLQWNFMRVQLTPGNTEKLTHTITIKDGSGAAGTDWKWYNVAGSAPFPKFNGVMSVKTKLTPTADWRALGFRPFGDISQQKAFNRIATTTANQELWSIKISNMASASAYPIYTLETYPYSYASASLYYQIDYIRESPAITTELITADNADNSIIWANRNWDNIIMFMAEALCFYQIGNLDKMQSAYSWAKMFAESALRDSGVPANRIHLPPFWVMKPPQLVENAD